LAELVVWVSAFATARTARKRIIRCADGADGLRKSARAWRCRWPAFVGSESWLPKKRRGLPRR